MTLLMSLALVALLSLARADVQFTSPAAGASLSGTTISVQWEDSGSSPPLSDFQTYQLFLCAGGNDPSAITVLTALTTTGEYSTGNSFSGTFQSTLGGTTKNAYFLKMISTAADGVVINYSSRFSLTGMTGSFPTTVQTALKTVSGTSGPATQNQIAAVNAGNAGNAATASGDFSIAYTLQTGPTRYAPMATRPGTKITQKNPTPLYPTSSYDVYQGPAGSPNAVFTVTQQNPTTVSSVEPTFAAAGMPSDSDMQKFLNRWKD